MEWASSWYWFCIIISTSIWLYGNLVSFLFKKKEKLCCWWRTFFFGAFCCLVVKKREQIQSLRARTELPTCSIENLSSKKKYQQQIFVLICLFCAAILNTITDAKTQQAREKLVLTITQEVILKKAMKFSSFELIYLSLGIYQEITCLATK